MRNFSKPFLKLPEVPDADAKVIAHWQLNEASGTTVADRTAQSNLTDSAGAANIIAAPLFQTASPSTLGNGRNPSSTFPTGGSSAAQRIALGNEWTVSVLVRPRAGSTGGTLVSHEGSGGLTTSNKLCNLGITSGGQIFGGWETGLRTAVTVTSTNASIDFDQVNVISIRKRKAISTAGRAAGQFDIDLFLNETHLATNTHVDLTNSTSGGSGNWVLMRNVLTNTTFNNGDIFDVEVISGAMSDEFFMDLYYRVVKNYDTDKMLASGSYAVHGRILCEDGDGVLQDLSALAGGRWDFVEHVQWKDDIDATGATATIELYRDIYKFSVAPTMSQSLVNSSTSGDPLLEIARKVKIYVAIVPEGTARSAVQIWEWQLYFEGFVSDVDWSKPIVPINCRDNLAPLQWTFIKPKAGNNFQEPFYGDDTTGIQLENVQQQIIGDAIPSTGYKGTLPITASPIVRVPGGPTGWFLRRRTQGFEFVADALTGKSQQIGMVTRYKWTDSLKRFDLTLYLPNRTQTTPDRVVAESEYVEITKASVTEESIRNVCDVVFTDRTGTLNTQSAFPFARVTTTDSTSVAKYGERYCQVAEDASSQIDTSTEGALLGNSVISDLSEPKVVQDVDAFFLPYCEIQDYYQFTANGIHFDTDQKLAVTGYTHSFSGDKINTTLNVRGQPSGKGTSWLFWLANPSVAPYLPALGPKVPAGSVIGAIAIEGGVRLSWPMPVNHGANKFDMTEIHKHVGAGAWTPDTSSTSASLIGFTRSNTFDALNLNNPTDDLQFAVIHKDTHRNPSDVVFTSGTVRSFVAQNKPAFRVHAGAKQNLLAGVIGASTARRAKFTVTDFDTRSGITTDATKTLYTVPVTGVYRFTVSTLVTYTGAADQTIISVFTNATADGSGSGTEIIRSAKNVNEGVQLNFTKNFTCDVSLTAGDTVVLKLSDTGVCTTAQLQDASGGGLVAESFWAGELLTQTA